MKKTVDNISIDSAFKLYWLYVIRPNPWISTLHYIISDLGLVNVIYKI